MSLEHQDDLEEMVSLFNDISENLQENEMRIPVSLPLGMIVEMQDCLKVTVLKQEEMGLYPIEELSILRRLESLTYQDHEFDWDEYSRRPETKSTVYLSYMDVACFGRTVFSLPRRREELAGNLIQDTPIENETLDANRTFGINMFLEVHELFIQSGGVRNENLIDRAAAELGDD